mgnify:CR=1 FL=1
MQKEEIRLIVEDKNYAYMIIKFNSFTKTLEFFLKSFLLDNKNKDFILIY